MSTHETNTGPITLINIFEVRPDKLESFLAGWRDCAELMSKRPGLRALRLHRAVSPDTRFQVIDVAVRGSADAFLAAIDQRDWREKAITAVDELGFTANPALCRVRVGPEITAQ